MVRTFWAIGPGRGRNLCALPGQARRDLLRPRYESTGGNHCTINHEPSAAYCAYHSQTSHGLVYASLSFPIYNSATGFTCSSDAVYSTVQTPNGEPDADTELSPTSHEIMEAITDPDVHGGWYDSSGLENGDE